MTMFPAKAMPISISHLAAGTPWWIYALVIGALALHIGGGLTGITSGYGAVTVRKGERLHRQLGKVFVAAMLVMATMGAALSVLIQQRGNIAGGVLAGYLVATAYMTVKRPEGAIGGLEKYAALVPALVSALFLFWGIEAVQHGGKLEGYRSPFYFSFAGIAALFTLMDLRVIVKGGLSGVARISRHLWRMCFGLFFATGSFFLGQQKIMPAWMHGSPMLWVLGLAPLGFMIFWLIRVRVGRTFKRPAAADAIKHLYLRHRPLYAGRPNLFRENRSPESRCFERPGDDDVYFI
jgi:hypothetical protein